MSQPIDYSDRPWMDPDAKPFIKVQSISKYFGDFAAVDSVDLEIYQGEIFTQSPIMNMKLLWSPDPILQLMLRLFMTINWYLKTG